VDIHSKLTNRSVNEGFSGGEKRKMKFSRWQCWNPDWLSWMRPTQASILMHLKVVANGVNKLRNPERATIIITHYQRLLDYIIPDFVHVLFDGKIVKSGGKELAIELEEKGYEWVKKVAGIEESV
jgi:Fe-S cluster assembly ATP-binding protein